MGLSTAFVAVAELLARWDAGPTAVREVVPRPEGVVAGGGVVLDVELAIYPFAGLDGDDGAVVGLDLEDGSLTIDLQESVVPVEPEDGGPTPSVSVADASMAPDGSVVAQLVVEVALPTDAGDADEADAVDVPDADVVVAHVEPAGVPSGTRAEAAGHAGVAVTDAAGVAASAAAADVLAAGVAGGAEASPGHDGADEERTSEHPDGRQGEDRTGDQEADGGDGEVGEGSQGEDRSGDREGSQGEDRTGDREGSQGADREGDPVPSGDVPVFEDVPYLRAVYESCGTFAEMAEMVELDVSAETVRRYMIDAGVHEATSYRTGGAGDAGAGSSAGTPGSSDDGGDETSADGEPPIDADQEVGVLVADGVGLPDGITVEQLSRTVSRSTTLFEVQQRLDADRETVRHLLEELGLLDLVMGRLAMESERSVTRAEVVDRLREHAAR